MCLRWRVAPAVAVSRALKSVSMYIFGGDHAPVYDMIIERVDAASASSIINASYLLTL